MSEDVQEHKQGVPADPHGETPGGAQLIKIVSTAVARLENARRNIQMYPEGHEAIRESLSAAYSSFVAVFARISPFSLEVGKNHLAAASHALDNRQAANKAFWTQLKHYGIAGLAFHPGVSQKELHDFLKLFVIAKDLAHRHDAALRKKAADTLPHVELTFVEYGGLGLTIEEEVSAPGDQDEKEDRIFGRGNRQPVDDLQRDSVYVIDREEDVSSIPPGISPGRPEAEGKTSGEATIIRGTGMGGGGTSVNGEEPQGQNIITDAEDYEKLLETYFEHAERETASGVSGETASSTESMDSDPLQPESPADTDAMNLSSHAADYEKKLERYFHRTLTPEKSVLNREEQKELVQTFLKQLNPTLKKQFASFDFEQLFKQEGDTLVKGMGDYEDAQKTLEALRQANEEDKEISPTLISLVKKMLLSSGAWEEEEKSLTPEADALQDKLENLFERETYEKFVVDQYDKKLKQLTSAEIKQQDGAKAFPLETYLETLEERWVNRRIARAMTTLIEDEDVPELYKDYLNCLTIIAHDFLGDHEYDIPEKIVMLIRRQGEHHPTPSIARLAQKETAHMMSPAYLGKVVNEMAYLGEDDWGQADGFLAALGSGIVPGLVKLYFEKNDAKKTRCIIKMLSCFHEDTVRHIKETIARNEGFLSEDLISLMSWFKAPGFVIYFRQLLDSDNAAIRDNVLDILLEYEDPDALDLLKNRIKDKSEAVSIPAIARVGRFGIISLVPVLIEELGRHMFFLRDITKKKNIVGVLGDMAEPSALPVFETIAGKFICLRSAELTALKVAVYQSLGKFEPADIQTLMIKGRKMKHERIQAAIAQLQERESKIS